MPNPQVGGVYRYFPIECDHDISADTMEVSIDCGATWIPLSFVEQADWPPSVVDAVAADPASSGADWYWWRSLTGAGKPLPLERGINTVLGRLTDSPETPNFAWTFRVGKYE